jgi:hypothetical protein
MGDLLGQVYYRDLAIEGSNFPSVGDPTKHTSLNLISVFDPGCLHGCLYRSPSMANWGRLEPQ